MNRSVRAVLVIVFAVLLLTPFLIRKFGRPTSAGPSSANANPLKQYGFRLTESAKAAGLDFVHQGPTLDPKLAHIMPQVASMGAAVSVVDVDRDGLPDLYVTDSKEGSRNKLFRNRGDGTFEDVAERMGVADVNHADTGVSMGAVWGDYDNDGFDDLFLYRWGRPDLFHNDHGQGFTRVTELAGLPQWANVNTAVWLDYDRDGLLDLFVGGYYPESINLWKLADTHMMPESFEYANNGGRKYLLHNLGSGRFEEVSERVGLASRRWALAAVAADLRGTGYPDLFVANDYGVSEYFANDHGTFREVGREAGVGFAPKSGMNASVGDVLNQGRFAIYVSNISEEGILLQGNNLWVPTTTTTNTIPKYENLARSMGVDLGGWSFGAQFADLNNDGFLDLYVVNGYVSASRTDSYWYDYSKVAGGNQIVISDAKNWPAMGDRSLGGYQQKKVWISDGAGHFLDVAQMVGVTDRYDGRSIAVADLSNRGVLDVVVANQRGPLLLYRNEVAPGPRLDRVRPRGSLPIGRCHQRVQQSRRDRRGGHRVLEWPAAGPGGLRRIRILRAEPAAPALRARQRRERRKGGGAMAIGQDAGAAASRGQPRSQSRGTRMTMPSAVPAPPGAPRRLRFDPRYLAPTLITCVLIAGQISFGFLESWSRTFLAIATAIAVELVAVRALYGKWPHLASAYVSGISVGILVRSPAFWPYALCAAISITSKYVLRIGDRHIWNPTNFGIVAMLLLAADTVAGLSVQWGNNLLPMVFVWVFGAIILRMVHRLHITLTYVASFLVLAVRAGLDDGASGVERGCAHHRTDVSALHLLHDHRPEDHGGTEMGAVPRCVPHRGPRSGVPSDAVRLRTVLCALHRRAHRESDRDRPRRRRAGRLDEDPSSQRHRRRVGAWSWS